MNKQKLGVALIAILLILCVSLLAANTGLKKTIVKVNEVKKMEVTKEVDLVKKDLESKYAADIVSYQAMVKRLELEKKKNADLEARLKAGKEQATALAETKKGKLR